MPDALNWTPAALATIRTIGLSRLDWDEPVALACSGGVDSTALLLLAAAMRDQLAPFVAIHVDHRTRPETASEGRQVADLCEALDVPFFAAQVDAEWQTGEHVAEHRLRAARYEALARVVAAEGLSAVVTAHTQDDQVETILMRLFAGAGSSGSAGMQSISAISTTCGTLTILRPLLGVTRRDLIRVLESANVEPIEDPSNVETRYTRNALRHEIIPALQRLFPGFPATLLRSMALIRDDAAAVDEIAQDAIAQMLEASGSVVRVDRAALRRASRPVASRVVRHVARDVSAMGVEADWRELSAERVDAVLKAAHGRTGARIELPYGVDVVIERVWLVFQQRGGRDDDDGRPADG